MNSSNKDNVLQSISETFAKCKNLIQEIDSEVFKNAFGNSSSIGAHMRHILDRTNCVVQGFASGKIDYDQRRRQTVLEMNPQLCVAEFDRLWLLINNFEQGFDQEIQVCETINSDGVKAILKSTIGREFLDITIHAIHHLATMKYILEQNNIEVEEDFGKNYSTVIYEKKLASN